MATTHIATNPETRKPEAKTEHAEARTRAISGEETQIQGFDGSSAAALTGHGDMADVAREHDGAKEDEEEEQQRVQVHDDERHRYLDDPRRGVEREGALRGWGAIW